jgi:hypothetical protein
VNPEVETIRRGLRAPRAAAIAGIVFSVLLTSSLLLIEISIPADPVAGAAELTKHAQRFSLAFNLLPYSGVCFLWFVGVFRDRLGDLEDRFLATVFLGSALLFLAMIFTAGSIAASILRFHEAGSEELVRSGGYTLARIEIRQVMHLYAIKMAGMFMFSTSTISARTRIFPRWMAILGFVLAPILLLGYGQFSSLLVAFPVWVFLISVYILIDNFQPKSPTRGT